MIPKFGSSREMLCCDARREGCGHVPLRLLPPALVAMMLSCSPLLAQSKPVELSARAGFVGADEAYQSNCGHSSLAFGVAVQGSGRVFPMAFVDHFVGSGGGDVLCLPVNPQISSAVGGLRLEGATRLGLGAGGRVGSRIVHVEGAVVGGLISGPPGYDGSDGEGARRVLPQVGIQGSLVLFRSVVLSVTTNLTRLPLDVTPIGGGAADRRSSWSPMTTVTVGVRVGVGRTRAASSFAKARVQP